MRQFTVPQFIDVEDKIFGPLSLKQFIYLLGGAAALFILFVFLPFFLFILLAIPVGGFAAALAFYKVNNQPFIKVVANAISYYTGSRLYIWRKREVKKKKIEIAKPVPATLKIEVPKITESRLKDIAWSLDVKEKIK